VKHSDSSCCEKGYINESGAGRQSNTKQNLLGDFQMFCFVLLERLKMNLIDIFNVSAIFKENCS
jgi:hypothetical protein